MTTLELKTSIVADLDQMSVEMLKSVLHYVKKLQQRTRNASVRPDAQSRRDAASHLIKTLSVQCGQPEPADERCIDALISEKYNK